MILATMLAVLSVSAFANVGDLATIADRATECSADPTAFNPAACANARQIIENEARIAVLEDSLGGGEPAEACVPPRFVIFPGTDFMQSAFGPRGMEISSSGDIRVHVTRYASLGGGQVTSVVTYPSNPALTPQENLDAWLHFYACGGPQPDGATL